jgi:hypothetical protein
LIKDTSTSWVSRVCNYFQLNKISKRIPVVELDENDIPHLQKILDGVKFLRLSGIEPVPVVKKKKNTVSAKKIITPAYSLGHTLDEHRWKPVDIDLSNGQDRVYIPTHHNQLMFSDRDFADTTSTNQISVMYKIARNLNLLSGLDEIYAIPASLRERELNGWVPFDVYIRAKFKEHLDKNPEMKNGIIYAPSYNSFKKNPCFDNLARITYTPSFIDALPKNHEFVLMINELVRQGKNTQDINENFSLLYSEKRSSFIREPDEYDLTVRWSKLMEKYPMFRYIFAIDANPLKRDFIQYVQQVDTLSAYEKKESTQ